MANDPAFLFYPGDYLRDTQCLSERAQVAYDRIMCEHMRNICITQDRLNFFIKRLTDDEKNEVLTVLVKILGGYHIPWVADSIVKRREYSDSRRKNRESKPKETKNISKSYVPHMENANEIESEDVIKDSIEDLLKGLDEIYIEAQRSKWKEIDFDFELDAFKEKVRGSPKSYIGHEVEGIRLAFQSQLRYAKKNPGTKAEKKNVKLVDLTNL